MDAIANTSSHQLEINISLLWLFQWTIFRHLLVPDCRLCSWSWLERLTYHGWISIHTIPSCIDKYAKSTMPDAQLLDSLSTSEASSATHFMDRISQGPFVYRSSVSSHARHYHCFYNSNSNNSKWVCACLCLASRQSWSAVSHRTRCLPSVRPQMSSNN